MTDNKLEKVLCIFTGGTLAMDSETLSSLHSADEILESVPELKKIASIDCCQLLNIDSVEMTPALWVSIAQKIYDEYDNYQGFVVVHGTDTMVYTASAMSFLLRNLGKPVIFTGSQIPLHSYLASDARNNLINAVRYALLDIAEVCIFFGSVLLRANRAKKISGFDVNAFRSFAHDPLGHAGVKMSVSRTATHRSHSRPMLFKDLVPDVFLLKIYPSMSPAIFDLLVEQGYKGIVLETFGTGNIPIGENSLIPAIRKAIDAGVTIVVTSQCEMGSVEDLYPAGKMLKESGAIMAADMTVEAALVKLMWVLGNARNFREIKDLMQTPLANEFSV